MFCLHLQICNNTARIFLFKKVIVKYSLPDFFSGSTHLHNGTFFNQNTNMDNFNTISQCKQGIPEENKKVKKSTKWQKFGTSTLAAVNVKLLQQYAQPCQQCSGARLEGCYSTGWYELRVPYALLLVTATQQQTCVILTRFLSLPPKDQRLLKVYIF